MDVRSARLLDALLTGYAASQLHPNPAKRGEVILSSALVLYLCGVPNITPLTPHTKDLEHQTIAELKKLMIQCSHAVRWREANEDVHRSTHTIFSLITGFCTLTATAPDPDHPWSQSLHEVDLSTLLTLPGTLDTVLGFRQDVLSTLKNQNTESSESAEMLYRLLESWREPGEAQVRLSADDLLWSARMRRHYEKTSIVLNLLRPGLDTLQAVGGLSQYELSEEGLLARFPETEQDTPRHDKAESMKLLGALGLPQELLGALARRYSPMEIRRASELASGQLSLATDNIDHLNPAGLTLWLLRYPDLEDYLSPAPAPWLPGNITAPS
ncbi:hypothetical protein [Deinococcus proteolyticus]|uniref:hypothetical protein n=1 Tax=Deinococcus proteolyticus TaxID=55148 RepID=UPI0003042564|nr:hypothetical protein [Deinococcus proteolyticus]